jgi:hypothetical protein
MMFGLSTKSAFTVVFVVTVIVQPPVDVQPPPDHPVNVDAVAFAALVVAASGISVPGSTDCVHALPQLMLPPVTVPLPSPVLLTVSVTSCVNVAVTVRACVIDTVQAPVPGQLTPAPDHPLNPYPLCGVAASVTEVPELKDALHVPPQLMPLGFDITVPSPDFVTVSA